jgi:hypothetical protein
MRGKGETLILISTSGRPEGYAATLEAIGDRHMVITMQDGGPPYAQGERVYFDKPGGKQMYWQRINGIWDRARVTRASHVMHLPDDFTYADGWLDAIEDAYTGNALNLHACGRTRMWGMDRWVDGAFIAPWQWFAAIAWRIPQPLPQWFDDPERGSGVWRYVSKTWTRRGLPIEHMAKPVIFGDFDPDKSQMNKTRHVLR